MNIRPITEFGFSIVELMIGSGLATIVILAAAVALVNMQKTAGTLKTQFGRISVISTARQNMAEVNYLRASLKQPKNEAFTQCVCGGVGTCTGWQLLEFSLYSPSDKPPKTNTEYYDAGGYFCDPLVTNCMFRVAYQFFAQCKPNPLPSTNPLPPITCGRAELVGVVLTISTNGSTGTPVYSGTTYTQVEDISPTGGTLGVCP